MKSVDMNEGSYGGHFLHTPSTFPHRREGKVFPFSPEPHSQGGGFVIPPWVWDYGVITWLCPWQQYTAHTFTEGLIHSWLPLLPTTTCLQSCSVSVYYRRWPSKIRPRATALPLLKDAATHFPGTVIKGEISVGTWGAVLNSQKNLTLN